ncbi:MptD family putative ECF transporter S component [Candidatus Woesearchaeota archaeon]|nr:MptD family putative ECF transporter S component [Candidatus Woesearchaeota archaeon]
MLKKFNTKQLVFIALAAALIFVINLTIGGAINSATGIPLSSIFFTSVIFGISVIIFTKILPKFGTWTLFLLIYSILELPTSLGGAPGFWPKIPINVITGILADITLYFVNYKKWGMFVGFYVLATVNMFLFAFFLLLLKIPGSDKLLKILYILIPAYCIIGTIGLFMGLAIWNRIKDKRIIRQILD